MSNHPHVKLLQTYTSYEQKTKEWFEERKKYITASNFATVLGMNKYKTPEKYFFELFGFDPFKGNSCTAHGETYEDEAIRIYEHCTGRKVYRFGCIPYNFLHPNDTEKSFLAGSVDGIAVLTDENGCEYDPIIIEVKCPEMRRIKYGECPEVYYPQIQCNSAICELEWTDFIEYVPVGIQGNDELQFHITRIQRNKEWFDLQCEVAQRFVESINHYRTIGIENHPRFLKYKNKNK